MVINWYKIIVNGFSLFYKYICSGYYMQEKAYLENSSAHLKLLCV